MKVAAAVILGLSTALASTPSLAGWGALACDVSSNGACFSSHGWESYGAAASVAMRRCYARGYVCRVKHWEHNSCTYSANGAYACN